jgi:hypothetical protein
MEKKYIARNVPLSHEKLAVLEAYRAELESSLGFKVSLSDAIIHAVKALKTKEAI